MNNDMAANLNNRINVQQNNVVSGNAIQKCAAEKTTSPISSEAVSDSMECLGTLGVVQVKMDKSNVSDSVRKSVEEYVKDPQKAEAYIDLCDSVVQRGYCLREAIEKTDCVFDILHEKETYNN